MTAIYIGYAEEDEASKEVFLKFLKILNKKYPIKILERGQLLAGQSLEKEQAFFIKAKIVILLLTIDFVNNDFLYRLFHEARLAHLKKEKTLILIHFRSIDIDELGNIEGVPLIPKGKAIHHPEHHIDSIFTQVIEQIQDYIDPKTTPFSTKTKTATDNLGKIWITTEVFNLYGDNTDKK